MVLGERMALGGLGVCPSSAHWGILLSKLSLEPRRLELAERQSRLKLPGTLPRGAVTESQAHGVWSHWEQECAPCVRTPHCTRAGGHILTSALQSLMDRLSLL